MGNGHSMDYEIGIRYLETLARCLGIFFTILDDGDGGSKTNMLVLLKGAITGYSRASGT